MAPYLKTVEFPKLRGPIPMVENLAVVSDVRNICKVDIGIDPLWLIEFADIEDPIVWKAVIDGRIDGGGPNVDINCFGPWCVANGRRLDDITLVFQGSRLTADSDPPIAGQGIGAAGNNDEVSSRLYLSTRENGEFAVVADINTQSTKLGVKGPDVVSWADFPLFIFKAGHLHFVLMGMVPIREEQKASIPVKPIRVQDWKCAGYDMHLMG